MILVVSGPGGVGKGTVVARLLELDPRLWLSRSWTTRPRRPGEPEDAYVFVSTQEFLDKLASEGFLEHTEFAANQRLYGTPIPEPPEGRDVVLEIDLDGARQVKARDRSAVLVLIVAPSADQQEARLRARGDGEAEIERRMALGAEEEERGRQIADHVVVNDDVDKAARQVEGIIGHHRAP